MQYTRTIQGTGWDNITTVDDQGNYEQVNRCPEGTTLSYYKTTLQEMGWNSTREFLRERKGFTHS